MHYACTVTYRLERSACNVESTGSSLVRDIYCAGTLSKFFAPKSATLQYYCICAARASALLSLGKKGSAKG